MRTPSVKTLRQALGTGATQAKRVFKMSRHFVETMERQSVHFK